MQESTINNYEAEMAQHARDILKHLEEGNSTMAMATASDLHDIRDNYLYQEIGKLTRSLHSAITQFDLDGKVEEDNGGTSSRMADASERLIYVLHKTENAANKTMDIVEDTVPISTKLGETATHLKGEWKRLMRREMSAQEFRDLYKDVDEFLDFADRETAKIGSNLSQILLTQDFQDLTGQALKRVITLVHDVEENLVDLVKMAASVEHITGSKAKTELTAVEQHLKDIEAEGPITNADERTDVVQNQDEVDELLSSLGF